MTRVFRTLAGISGFLLMLSPSRLAADIEIPAFARKYKVSCNMCHDPAPKLNDFGETFAGNGFKFAPNEDPRDTINTGDDLLDLTRNLPLALRMDVYAQAFTNGEVASDWKTPYNVKILSGGPISKKLSYYLYFFLFERGKVGGIEDAFIQWNDIGDAPVDLIVGQFQVSDPLFKRELRLQFQDYVIYRTRVGLQPTDLTYDRGIMVPADIGPLTVTGVVVNGSGKGEAFEDLKLDNNAAKNFMGHVTGNIVPEFRLGVMGYGGKEQGTVADGLSVTNHVWMGGADATLSLGTVEFNIQYIHREDGNPTFTTDEAKAITNGGFAELIWRPERSRWYALALYNQINCNQPLLDVRLGAPPGIEKYQALTGGGGYLIRRNFRLMGEVSWDFPQEMARWTLGLMTAF
jgi:hypothetical protein